MTRTTSTKRARSFKVGDKINLVLGEHRHPAVIVEDRGFIGKGGRQLLRIRRTNVGVELAAPYEVPAENVEHAD